MNSPHRRHKPQAQFILSEPGIERRREGDAIHLIIDRQIRRTTTRSRYFKGVESDTRKIVSHSLGAQVTVYNWIVNTRHPALSIAPLDMSSHRASIAAYARSRSSVTSANLRQGNDDPFWDTIKVDRSFQTVSASHSFPFLSSPNAERATLGSRIADV